ncbi:MAG TPA: hypothetical protein VKV28_16775 [Candidatus Binataceae bacterium]|nr:hypothetical protein [Candidatus Binataceae bacterium]
MAEARLRSSFIYLANAVREMTAYWRLIALGLAPIALLASLCLLPDALNLQHSLVRAFEPGTRSVSYFAVQMPYPARSSAALAPLFPLWMTRSLHLLFLILTAGANLVALCIIRALNDGTGKQEIWPATRAVYREALRLVPAFYWVALLQIVAMAVGAVMLIVPAVLAFIWLYFAQYSLVIDGYRSWPALLHSRELMRGRFFAVAVRIVVFLAVWSGYNSWAGAAFVGISLLIGLLGALTGSLWSVIWLADLLSVSVAFLTSYFFLAAGYRLYQDLKATATIAIPVQINGAQPSTGPLRRASTPALAG